MPIKKKSNKSKVKLVSLKDIAEGRMPMMKAKKRNYAATEGTLINVRAAKKRDNNLAADIERLVTIMTKLTKIVKDHEERVKKLESGQAIQHSQLKKKK